MKLRYVASISAVTVILSFAIIGCDAGTPAPNNNTPPVSAKQQAENMANAPGLNDQQRQAIRDSVKTAPADGASGAASTGK